MGWTYRGWAMVQCPSCFGWRKVRRGTVVQIALHAKKGKTVICRACSNTAQSARALNQWQSKRNERAEVSVNGCLLEKSDKGRGEECVFCIKYSECLGEIAKLDWPGWRVNHETKSAETDEQYS